MSEQEDPSDCTHLIMKLSFTEMFEVRQGMILQKLFVCI